MKNRIVKLVYPKKLSKIALVSVSRSKVPFSKSDTGVYETVDFFRDKIFLKSKIKMFDKKIRNRVLLREVVNLHNDDGIKDISQVRSMIEQLKFGRELFMFDGLPNIKLVKTKQNDWVLFDGHHSMFAYIYAGRKYLDEIPHLIVEDEKNEYVSDEEICVFFGKHLKKFKSKDWREYVINWQASKKAQLCKRVQKNIGELFDSLSKILE